ncbi:MULTISPECIES: hypothetical protein [Arthrobacter]|uniref:Uncharacterized protein n=1 Tax=Arthrobacter terricola TaxID=2547396 RepID=A0A4R5K742_9MICC|nr:MULTISPECIES: hypothetical protein [Arthrobacter]MBT8163626.1 hypothetical protein [Arthrobacter sp. GN70]TDF88334.1 hypothetical protein E1809_23925 [Arthrobacter terricola]
MVDLPPGVPGEAFMPRAPGSDGPLRIRGGVGGLSFQFEELLSGASALDDVVCVLQSVESEAALLNLALLPHQTSTYSNGTKAFVAVGDAGREIARVREQLQRMGADVRASHREYEYAESHAAIMMRIGLGMAALGTGPDLVSLPRRDATEGVMKDLPQAFALMLGLEPGAARTVHATVAPGDTGGILRGIAAAPGLAHLKPRPVSVSRGEETIRSVELTAPGLLKELDQVSFSSQGEIEVLQVDNARQRAWVVLIPGTQSAQLGGRPGGDNPLDEAGIVEALGYGSAETSQAIHQALCEAGAEAGDVVVAVGHSQGGIHAMNLSQDKAFLADYNLRFVVTAGSPVGGITPEAGIGSLHLEHENDWVPGADGKVNPDTKDRVTVTMTNAVTLAPGEDPGIGPEHKLSRYVEGAELARKSTDPSLVASTAALGGVLGVGGMVRSQRFKLHRAPALPAPSGCLPDVDGAEPTAARAEQKTPKAEPSDIRSRSGAR